MTDCHPAAQGESKQNSDGGLAIALRTVCNPKKAKSKKRGRSAAHWRVKKPRLLQQVEHRKAYHIHKELKHRKNITYSSDADTFAPFP